NQKTALFWATLLLGVLASLATGIAGHLFAKLYDVPELVWICWAFAATSFVEATGLTHQTLLQREMRIGRIATIKLVGQALAVTLAVFVGYELQQQKQIAKYGIVALLVMEYVELLVNTIGLWLTAKWKPGRMRFSEVKGLLSFGGFYSTSSLVFYVGQNLDKVLLAAMIGSTRSGQRFVGMYTSMYHLMMKPVYLVTDPVTSVMLPSLSRSNDRLRDYAAISRGFYLFTATLLIPAGVGLFVMAPEVVQLLGGDKWKPAVGMLIALAPAICVHGIINISGSLLVGRGQVRRLLGMSLVLLLLQAQAYGCGYFIATQYAEQFKVSQEQALAVAIAMSYSAVLLLVSVPYIVVCFRSVQLSSRALLFQFVRLLARALLMGVAVWFIRNQLVQYEWHLILRLLVGIVAGAALYTLLAWNDIKVNVLHFMRHRE
ncbi:MAG: oligosaccharide flippase family protein, partial [Pirellulaceae bacterium]|nr:oligosaccharide flippase family protein [Pirellulaceae bacterium]